MTLRFATDTQQQTQLRAAYSTLLVAADEANEGLANEARDESAVLNKYFARRRFTVGILAHRDSVALADSQRRGREMVARLRKASFDLLLLEPSAAHRQRVRTFVSEFLDGKQQLDRKAGVLRALIETGSYPAGSPPPAEGDDPLGAFHYSLEATRTHQSAAYAALVNTVLEDDRWR